MPVSPEEILALSLQPTMQAVNNYAAGQTDMAKLQYLSAVKRKQEADDFARSAQQAREMLALHNQAQAAQADRSNKYIADREDKRQTELTKREDLRQKAMLDRMTSEEKQRTIRGLITDLGGNAVSRAKGESDDDYIVKLITATNKRKEDATAANTKAIGIFDTRLSEKQTEIDNILNPEQDPQKQELLNAEVDRQLLPFLAQELVRKDENNNPVVPGGDKKLEQLTKAIKSGRPIEQAAALAGLSSHLTSARTILKSTLAEQMVSAADKIRLSGLQKDVLQLQGERSRIERGDPEAARRAAVATADAILKLEAPKTPKAKQPEGLQSAASATGLPAGISWLGDRMLSESGVNVPPPPEPPRTYWSGDQYLQTALGENPKSQPVNAAPANSAGVLFAPAPVAEDRFVDRNSGISGAINLFNPVSPQNIINRVYGNAGNGMGFGQNLFIPIH